MIALRIPPRSKTSSSPIPSSVGEDQVADRGAGEAEQQRDAPRLGAAHVPEDVARHEHPADHAGHEPEDERSDHAPEDTSRAGAGRPRADRSWEEPMMSPRAAGLLVSLLAVLATAAPALAARPPAQGAPGTRHTWAPADKHGFGTAHQLAGHAYFTLRQGVAERGLLPRPLHPGLPRAAVRGHRRQDVRGPRGRRRRPAPHRARRARRDGDASRRSTRTLGFRQVTENARWRLTKTWITDPARDTVLARVRFEAKTRTALRALRARRRRAGQRRQRRPRDLRRADAASPTTTRPRAPSPPRPAAAADLERLPRHRRATRGATCRTTRSTRHRRDAARQRRAGRAHRARRQGRPGR